MAQKSNRIVKMVFTLRSGKSIVVSMNEDQAFSIYDQWVNFIPNSETDISKIKIEKKKNNNINTVTIYKHCFCWNKVQLLSIYY